MYSYITSVFVFFYDLYLSLKKYTLSILYPKLYVKRILVINEKDLWYEDLTEEYRRSGWDAVKPFHDTCRVDVEYCFDDTVYRVVYPTDTPVVFPPFDIAEVESKIIHFYPKSLLVVTLGHIEDNPITENCMPLVQMYAGPLKNFYGRRFQYRWMFPTKDVSHTFIKTIDTHGNIRVDSMIDDPFVEY